MSASPNPPHALSPPKQSLLFVGGETPGLHALREGFTRIAPEWACDCAASGVAALEALARLPAAAVVADVRLADMRGDQLLDEVMHRLPRAHRLVLADVGDLHSLLRCVGNVHQFVAQPCEPERLRILLERAAQVDVWLPHQTVRELVGRLPHLPSPEAGYQRVVRELESPTATPQSLGALVAQDPAMTAKLLQLANSAAYGLPTNNADPVEAIKEIGLANTRAALLLAHSYSNFTRLTAIGFSVDALWQHSRAVANGAACLARAANANQALVQQAATAGLLHDLGKLALAVNLPDAWRQVLDAHRGSSLDWWEAEQEVLGATHAEVGASLLGLWGLPLPIIEAVALHPHPVALLGRSFSPLAAVHVANAFAHATSLEQARARVDRDYLDALGLESRLADWWARCRAEAPELWS